MLWHLPTLRLRHGYIAHVKLTFLSLSQGLDKGFQKEMPDIWLQNGNPWEIARPNISYRVGFYGSVDNYKWTPAEEVSAVKTCQR